MNHNCFHFNIHIATLCTSHSPLAFVILSLFHMFFFALPHPAPLPASMGHIALGSMAQKNTQRMKIWVMRNTYSIHDHLLHFDYNPKRIAMKFSLLAILFIPWFSRFFTFQPHGSRDRIPNITSPKRQTITEWRKENMRKILKMKNFSKSLRAEIIR